MFLWSIGLRRRPGAAARSFDPAPASRDRPLTRPARPSVSLGHGLLFFAPAAVCSKPAYAHCCGDPEAEITLDAACPASLAPATVEEVYEAACPSGAWPLWRHLAYDTATPSDSRVEIRVAASADPTFAGAADHLLAVAQASTGTSHCGMGGPAPCPLDLAEELGEQEDGHPFLRLRLKLVPSTDGTHSPTLNEWKVTYSCPDAE
jgi:hypothetical protein